MATKSLPVVFALVCALAFAACGGHGSIAAVDSLAAKAVLTDGDMPGFTFMVADCQRDMPSWSFAQSLPTQLAWCESAFVTNEAFSGEGRAQVEAQARADGYDPTEELPPGVTPWPDIQGPFVATHHGVLEVFDSIWIESSPEAAAELYKEMTASP